MERINARQRSEIDQDLVEEFALRLKSYHYIIKSLNAMLSKEQEGDIKGAENNFTFALETVISNLKADIKELEEHISTIPV